MQLAKTPPWHQIEQLATFDLSGILIDLKLEKLAFDQERNVFRTESSTQTLASIFGTYDTLRNWHSFRFGVSRIFRRAFLNRKSFCKQQFWLPSDAVVIANASGGVIVVISAENDAAVKIEAHPNTRRVAKRVQGAWDRFNAVGMGCYLPELLKSGQIGPDIFYAKYRLAKNRSPFLSTYHSKKWPIILHDRVLPILQRFHNLNGYSVVDGPGWAFALKCKRNGRLLPKAMEPFWQATLEGLEKFPTPIMPIGLLHGDFQPQNIHLCEDQVKILDWSSDQTGALIIDIFAPVFYPAMHSHACNVAYPFWAYVLDEVPLEAMPPLMKRTGNVWASWMRSWLGLAVGDETLRLQLRGMCWDWLFTMPHAWQSCGEVRRSYFPNQSL